MKKLGFYFVSGVFVLLLSLKIVMAENIEIQLPSKNGADAFQVQDSTGGVLMNILSDGKVGIGKSPNAKFDISGNMAINGNVVIDSTGKWVGDSTGLIGPQGVKGDKGDTGNVGPQGLTGLQGSKGDTGVQGPIGSQGTKGDTGDVGPQGPTGLQGAKGDTGDVGPQGPTGSQGVKGDKGDTGDAFWTVSGSDIYYNSGRVGIGVTNPEEQLEISGKISITDANHNIMLGKRAGYYNVTGSNNCYLGYYAGYYNTTGYNNIFSGYSAGYNNTNGFKNTFLGGYAGYNNINGCYNTFVGSEAGISNNSGIYNSFFGSGAGWYNTTGSSNTILGYYAGLLNTSGSGNVFLGYRAGYNEAGSDKLYIDNSNTTTPLIYGDFANDTVIIYGKLGIGAAPANKIYVSGGAYCDGSNWTNASSRDYKENIKDINADEAVAVLKELKPVKFNYKDNKNEECVGFIAEDVPDLVAVNGRKGLSPMDFVGVLTKVVQEQQKEIEELKRQIEKLK